MTLLFDACVPRPLRKFLPLHTVRTAQEMGWPELKNGDLLREAENQFDAMVTTDKNLKYQQNLTGRRIAILVLPTNDWPELRCRTDEIALHVNGLRPGDFIAME